MVEIDYDPDIENGLAGDQEVADFCREFRAISNDNGVSIIVSYRAIQRLAKMTQLLDLDEALKTCLIKDLEKDDLRIIYNNLSSSKYKDAVGNLLEAMA